MKQRILIGILSLLPLIASGQTVFPLDSLPAGGVLLDKGWKWHLGDNPEWSKPGFDDSRWDTLNPIQNMNLLSQLPQQGIGWLRIRLRVAQPLRGKPIGLYVQQLGATEFFLNEQLVGQSGLIGVKKGLEQGVFETSLPFVVLQTDSVQVLVVRYAFSKERFLKSPLSFLQVRALSTEGVGRGEKDREFSIIYGTFLFSIFLILGVLHLLLFIVSTQQRATLYLGLFLVCQSITHFSGVLRLYDWTVKIGGFDKVALRYDMVSISLNVAITLSAFFYLTGIYGYFRQPKRVLFIVVAGFTLATIPIHLFLNYTYALYAQLILAHLIPWGEILRIGIVAVAQKKPGAKPFTLAHAILFAIFTVFTVVFLIPAFKNFLGDFNDYLLTISFLGLALTISLLIAQERAAAHKLLQQQFVELGVLSQKNIAQEQEKQHLLATQNERLEQQVEARTAELKASQAQLIQKEKLASLGELTAGIAHEIQNPLNFVNNFSEVSAELIDELEEELTKGETQEAKAIAGDLRQNLQKIHHHGGRASSIVRGMLEHSRTESGEKRPTNLNALAQEYLNIAYHGLRAKDKSFNCELVTNFSPELGRVEVAPQEIGRVFLNLYNNAFYAVSQRQKQLSTDYQPTVMVSTKRLPKAIEIRVWDNGTGIRATVRDKIFQPFFTTKPTGEGTGLGLSLSYDIVTKGHGGTLRVESQDGKGTEFILQIPGG